MSGCVLNNPNWTVHTFPEGATVCSCGATWRSS